MSSSFALLVLLAAAPGTYVVDPSASEVQVHVGRAGLLKFAGHEHEVLTSTLEGRVTVDGGDPTTARVELRFPLSGLRVSGKGEPPDDVPQVQAKMDGPDVLDVARFPEATFTSRRVEVRKAEGAAWALTIAGDLKLHGVTRAMEIPLDVVLADRRLTATGRFTLRHADFGMSPVSVAGVVKVKEEIEVSFRIVAGAVGE